MHVSNLVHSNTDGIVRSAGISVVPQGLDGPWFAAFADRKGTITVVPLPIARDGAITPPYIGGAVTVPGATTERATPGYPISVTRWYWRGARPAPLGQSGC